MIWKPRRFNRKKNLDKELANYGDIYIVQSELVEATCYGLQAGTFAIIRPIGALLCNLDDVPAAAEELEEDVKTEVLSVYADIRQMGLERVW